MTSSTISAIRLPVIIMILTLPVQNPGRLSYSAAQ